MKKLGPREFTRIFWPHWVGGLISIGLFAYQLVFALPARPREPDVGNGYTIEFELNPDAVYVSVFDLGLLFATLILGGLIIALGLWRVQTAQKAFAE